MEPMFAVSAQCLVCKEIIPNSDTTDVIGHLGQWMLEHLEECAGREEV